MAKNYSKRNKTRKSLIAMLCALSVTCTGLAAACAPNDNNEEDNSVTAREDVQLLKNGNFEHFDIPDKAVHLIKNVNNWSIGGDTSVKSGVINVAKKGWDELTAEDLAAKLDYNNDLSSSNEEYVNYNSMRSRDLLYKDNYAATLETDDVEDSWIKNQGYETYFDIKEEDGKYYLREIKDENLIYKNADDGEYYFDEGFTKSVRKEQIVNPKTHYVLNEDETKVTVGGKEYDVKTEEKTGSYYYTDEDKNDIYISNVLMVHNSPTDTKFNGVNQYYTSSTITLEANTSAEISFWVKTSDLKFDKGYSALDDEDKGAYVEVVQTVANTTIDNFAIKAINTEKIIAGAEKKGISVEQSNGWLQYTVYVNACDFASSTVQLRLGLGGSDVNEKVTGYAFFDDVQVTKYRSLEEAECTYDANNVKNTSCNLISEAEDKIFYADVQKRGLSEANWNERNAYDFHYLIDLASEQGDSDDKTYKAMTFGTGNVEVGLTTEKDSKNKTYAASDKIENGVISGVGTKTNSDTINLVKDTQSLSTSNDLIGAFATNKQFSASDFTGTDYSKELNDAVKGLDKLPVKQGGNMLALFSAWGVPYTATISDTSFKVGGENTEGYKLVSLWVKTSDMDGGTAATLKIYEEKDNLPVEDSVQTITIDTTGNKVNFGNEKDIYNGWVQCFFFVKNDTKTEKTFKIDFGFGTTSIISANGSYESGWAIISNMQTLNIDKEVYDLASSGSTTALFSFYDEEEDTSGNAITEANGTSDIKKGIALPDDNYSGKNGASSSVSANENRPSYDASNSHNLAGLINRKYATDYANWDKIASSFASAGASWDEAFGANCYQPLIIINDGLRKYADIADAKETNYNNGTYYIEVADDATDYDFETVKGKKYKNAQGTAWSETEKYYTLSEVINYGYVGANKSVSANNTETISVRVKVVGEGASAWVYLVDTEDAKNVLSYTTPTYTFYYDEEGNVLDSELDDDWKDKHRDHILYTLRDDGLYDSKEKDGKVYANLNNLIKSYKDSKYEHNSFYDKDGNYVSYDDLKDGETYYKSETLTKENIAEHYLCTSDGTNVYEYKDGKYFYLEKDEDGKMNATTEVNNFADNTPKRYDTAIDKQFAVEVTSEDCKNLGDKDGWVTVNFVIQSGSEAKDYRLELWSGARDEKGEYNGNTTAVAFDVSQHSVNNVETRLKAYENEILTAYYRLISSLNKPELFDEIKTENITAYKNLVAELIEKGELTKDTVKESYGYDEHYYAYTLYDSTSYIPFNANTASESETGYNYDSSLFGEKLAYFAFDDDRLNSKNVFVDYTVVDQDITLNTDSDSDDDDEEDSATSAELGLYISSIVLVAVLLITLVSIGITQFIKNKRNKNGAKSAKNVYRKKDRYIKKLHLVKNEEVEENGENVQPEEVSNENPDGENKD